MVGPLQPRDDLAEPRADNIAVAYILMNRGFIYSSYISYIITF